MLTLRTLINYVFQISDANIERLLSKSNASAEVKSKAEEFIFFAVYDVMHDWAIMYKVDFRNVKVTDVIRLNYEQIIKDTVKNALDAAKGYYAVKCEDRFEDWC